MEKNISEFISNNVYLNKLITNKIKKGKKAISIKIIHSFLILLNNYTYTKFYIFTGYNQINKKDYNNITWCIPTISILLINIITITKINILLIKKAPLIIKINKQFKRITPVILMYKLKTSKKGPISLLPIIKRNNTAQINIAARIFLKHALPINKKIKKKSISKSFIDEYIKIKKYISKCIKEKLYLYRRLSNALDTFKYKFKYKAISTQ